MTPGFAAHTEATINDLRVKLAKAEAARDCYLKANADLGAALDSTQEALVKANARAGARLNMLRTVLAMGQDAGQARREALALLDTPLPGQEAKS